MFNPYLPTTICHWHWHWHCLGKIGSNIASTTSATCGSPIVQNGSISFSSLAVTVGSVLVSRSSPPLYYALMRTPSLETWVTDFCGHLLLTCHELRKLNLILQASTMISVSHLGPSFGNPCLETKENPTTITTIATSYPVPSTKLSWASWSLPLVMSQIAQILTHRGIPRPLPLFLGSNPAKLTIVTRPSGKQHFRQPCTDHWYGNIPYSTRKRIGQGKGQKEVSKTEKEDSDLPDLQSRQA
ncbi:hypothetical protein HDV62DRAFT_85922 [Trichoderma sp. SZMC 28011]